MLKMPFARGTAKLVVILCIASIASGLRGVGPYLKRTVTLMKANIGDTSHARNDIVPTSSVSNDKGWTVQAFKSLTALSVAAIPLLTATKAKAVGELFEFKELNMVIQDISFNVGNTLEDSEALATLFQNNIRPLRTRNDGGFNVTVLAFGPDAFASPPSFIPGISTFYEDGGHATITLKAKNLQKDSDVVEIFEKGNGLQFIKVGAEVIRLSKAIEKGVNVKGAYGWVDLDTPAGIPMEVVIGLARDPIMLACIRVTNVAASAKFFIDELGMKVLPFPISRPKGSTFEPEQTPGSQYVGYSGDTMGLLLTPSPKLKAPPLVVGTMLESFTLVYDDSAAAVTAGKMPPAVGRIKDGASNVIKSPDGYTFVLKGYEQFKKEATSKIDF